MPELNLPTSPPTPGEIKDAAAAFASDWLSEATAGDLSDLLATHPRVPKPLDRELLGEVERRTGGNLRGNDLTHRAVRQAFWTVIQSAPHGSDAE